ncbi:hypothetical protein ACIP01_06265 [Pseudomonas monteilii]|uniref:hypothetical protein n=1 Tax=Pseudomonas monteilii TaxID=76759 RepID=UPI003827B722
MFDGILSSRNYFLRVLKDIFPLMMGVVFAICCILFVWGGALKVKNLALADCIQIVIMLFIAGTMVVAIVSHVHGRGYSQSETNLEKALSLVDRAAEIIVVDGQLTNDRVAWVTCARLLTRAEALSQKITTETHSLIFEGERDFWRYKFRDLLRPNGTDLSGAFFCGGKIGSTIGEAVTSASGADAGKGWIPTQIVNVVYMFMSFPEGYEDPLRSSLRFGSKERSRLALLGYKGVHDYLVFRKNFAAVGSRILRRGDYKAGAVSASEIDDQIFADSFYDEEDD